jgi:hypothetical protein
MGSTGVKGTVNQFHSTVVQFTKMLRNLDRWLDEAVDFAKAKKIDPSVLLEARLAPDAFPLIAQIQAACDGAKFAAARFAGKDPPKHPDTEKTHEEIRARIQTVLTYLGSFQESDFDGAEKRMVPLGFMPGKAVTTTDFLHEMNTPNTYFHLTMAYAILRHNGVPLGKTAFIGSLNLKDL